MACLVIVVVVVAAVAVAHVISPRGAYVVALIVYDYGVNNHTSTPTCVHAQTLAHAETIR